MIMGSGNAAFFSFGPLAPEITQRFNLQALEFILPMNLAASMGRTVSPVSGVLIATEQGNAIAYALFNIQERGKLFINPQVKVYQGMIIGENSRENDLEVNVLKGKKLTNVRASGSDEAVKLTPPIKMSLEDMMSFIKDDELLEITPQSLRLRKKFLNSVERKRNSKL